jgi:hypothetical protein
MHHTDDLPFWKVWGVTTLIMFGCLLAGYLLFLATRAHARPNAAWEAQRVQAQSENDAETLRRLRYVGTAGTLLDDRGKTFRASCCGEADAYESDDFETDADGNLFAVLTCNDQKDCQEIKGKTVRLPGAKFKVPANKMLVNHDPTNDTGHGWVWIANTSFDEHGQPVVYCYAPPSGG